MATGGGPEAGVPPPSPEFSADVAATVIAGVEALSDGFVVFEPTGQVVYANPAFTRILEFETSADLPANVLELLHPDDLTRALGTLTATQQGFRPRGSTEVKLRRGDGTFAPFDLAVGLILRDGEVEKFATEVRPAIDHLSYREVLTRLLDGERLAAVLDPLPGLVSLRNPNALCGLAYTNERGELAVAGTTLTPLLSGSDRSLEPWAQTIRSGNETYMSSLDDLPDRVAEAARAHGVEKCWVVPLSVDDNDEPTTITVWTTTDGPDPRLNIHSTYVVRQLTELVLRWRHQAERVDWAATHDHLTGLANRASLMEFIETPQTDDELAVLMLDLDHFKPINDTHGHAAGDEVLRVVAERIRHAVRPSDFAARMGGDEFVVACPGCTREQASVIADRLLMAIQRPIQVGDTAVNVGVSIGVSHESPRSTTQLANADAALYAAKSEGRTMVCWAGS